VKGREDRGQEEGEGFFLLSIRGLRKGPGKFLMGVMESPGFFVSKRVGTLALVLSQTTNPVKIVNVDCGEIIVLHYLHFYRATLCVARSL